MFKGVIARSPLGDEAIFIKNMDKRYYIYIMTNKKNSVLYTGVTNNLIKRVYEHKNKLVFYEACNDVTEVIVREKQIKGGSRAKKVKLIEDVNKNWNDLYDNL